ncbi:hypothetical protein A2422_04120 [Candidatus Woesebacteria bacterium RIFOXYC1_FULL_31_51]|uniref:Formiminotetrahydrofolate cyclodeaminase n=1 Tax=Candidatus Woesebacteria bacterium GW2011_GWC2_31_9 TaxID=1618586 RepID=A0A0F9YLE1_9BACT|nr:MAG: formiminotetrahydrofolate cyclodeaminase, formiminotetrahydrofolate cyclodeaminase [Candidatus Woesebacteria bacterium GW2011_GWF1_31_35]KKP22804.1 MAG: Formiminotetrahydrofolate cyclodeaminase [Candidatus Woesebacteria bacterium GW2011_GWC1_30_29]KKP26708.1 MAG: Formiminotetrahydrofolate cyclodeaminase [Candidatus Woesebacteria bacterium GW2011_GWD1_31_12]KKP28052.1 MAG: Formiminotetrahydrofolate cyclodeaminase [Candidatus Woesebacteria bacterium GW2011_GWB1_31_29]KKP32279.1 MAG: Formi
MNYVNKQTINKFQKELGSKNPTPGSGVVSALTASFAASLVEMVCNLTIDKVGYEKVQKDIIKYRKDVVETKNKLSKLAEEDKRACDKVVLAYKIKNKEKIRKALNYAINVSMKVREITKELEILAVKVGKIGNKNALSDAKIAVHFAHASGKSALENIKTNKESLKKMDK